MLLIACNVRNRLRRQLGAAGASTVCDDRLLSQALIGLLSEDDTTVLTGSLAALTAVTGAVPKEALASHARTLRDAVSTARERQRRKRRAGEFLVPGFCLPKALAPVLPIYLQVRLLRLSRKEVGSSSCRNCYVFVGSDLRPIFHLMPRLKYAEQ